MRSRSVVTSTAALLASLAFGVAGCSSDGLSPGASGVSTDPGAPSASPTGPIDEPSTSGGSGMIPDELLAQVRQDAASVTGGDPAAVTIVRAESVTWPNGAAGCPQPGMLYTEALVPGYWVVVESEGRTLDFRGGRRTGTLRLCENPPPGPG